MYVIRVTQGCDQKLTNSREPESVSAIRKSHAMELHATPAPVAREQGRGPQHGSVGRRGQWQIRADGAAVARGVELGPAELVSNPRS